MAKLFNCYRFGKSGNFFGNFMDKLLGICHSTKTFEISNGDFSRQTDGGSKQRIKSKNNLRTQGTRIRNDCSTLQNE